MAIVGLVLSRLRLLWRVAQGQDLVEYALMAGFVAVAAGAIMPDIGASLATVFSKVGSVLLDQSGQMPSI